LHKFLIHSGKLIVATAAVWAVGASLYVFFSPVMTSRGSSSWYEAQGLWGVLVLAIFCGLYILAVRLAWSAKYRALVILSVLAIGLSIVTGFSIGAAYLPAALGLFVGALVLLIESLY